MTPPTEDPAARQPLSRRMWIITGVLTLLLVASVVWLFSGEGSQPEPPANVESFATIDGTLVEIDDNLLTMEPFEPLDGKKTLKFVIRPKDADQFDLAHLRSHSSIGLPTRIFYEEDDGTLYAVFKEDAPVNTKATAAT